jgi:hypothetical protein
VHEHSSGNPATSGIRAWRQRNVVADHNYFRRDTFRSRQFCSEAKIQPVTGVTLHQQQDTAWSCNRTDRSENRIDAGRREDVTGHRSAQHPCSDITSMSRFVPCATTGDQRNLPGFAQPFRRGIQHDHLPLEQRKAGRQSDDPLEHFGNNTIDVIDQLFHFDLTIRA